MTGRDRLVGVNRRKSALRANRPTGAGYWLSIVLMLLGCGGAVTSILPITGERAKATARACGNWFPRGGFEATSIVEASIPYSDDSSLIAVVTSPSDQSEFRSVMMTLEGVVLFDATRRGERVEVHRALPPLDPSGFGRQMTDDIRLVSFRPQRGDPEVGITEAGIPICRWTDGDRTVDVLLSGVATAKVLEMRRGHTVREAWLKNVGKDGRAREILLENTGATGYRLRLVLQSYEPK